MSDDIFDAIIVGGGLAGGTAAYVLAQAGCDVLVVERGNFAGSKNMTGDVYTRTVLKKSFPILLKKRQLSAL
ncbi:FAD-dependent oxidoreductase [Proteus mirabilis]